LEEVIKKEQEQKINADNFVQGIDYYHDPDEMPF